jgi:DNA-binding transcriptional LysR family regulator
MGLFFRVQKLVRREPSRQTNDFGCAIIVLMISLEWYRSFVHVCRSGTVSSAARGLGLTQPAVSQHLAGLEAALGQRLFLRKPRRMELTNHGQALYSSVAEAIEQLELVGAAGAVVTTPLRLGAPNEFFQVRLLEALARDPALALSVELGSSPPLLDRLEAGALDAVVSTVKRASSSLVYRGLFEEHFWLVAPPETAPPSRRALASWLRDQRWVAYGPDLPIIRRFSRQVLGARLPVTPQLSVPDLCAVLRAVELGMGVSVLPDYLCQAAIAAGRVCLVLAPEEPVSNDLWWVTTRRASPNPRIASLFSLLRGET